METTLFYFTCLYSIVTIIAYDIPDGFVQYENGCAWAPDPSCKPKEVITTPPPYISLNENMPVNFSWLTAGPSNSSLVTPVRNQMLPNPCGSCWAISAVGALSTDSQGVPVTTLYRLNHKRRARCRIFSCTVSSMAGQRLSSS